MPSSAPVRRPRHPIPEATRITLTTVKDDGGRRLAGIQFRFIAGTAGAPGPPRAS